MKKGGNISEGEKGKEGKGKETFRKEKKRKERKGNILEGEMERKGNKKGRKSLQGVSQ